MDPVFRDFVPKLIRFLRELGGFQADATSPNASGGHEVLDTPIVSRRLKDADVTDGLIHPLLQITTFKLLRVPYISCDDWRSSQDLVRCHPMFHGRKRFDCVLINEETERGVGFGRLRALFRCWSMGQRRDIAFVQRSDVAVSAEQVDIGLPVVRERQVGEFVLVDRIQRGAHLISTSERERNGDQVTFFVNDLVDYDMVLRLDPDYVWGT